MKHKKPAYKPTPTLKGKDAERFLEKMREKELQAIEETPLIIKRKDLDKLIFEVKKENTEAYILEEINWIKCRLDQLKNWQISGHIKEEYELRLNELNLRLESKDKGEK